MALQVQLPQGPRLGSRHKLLASLAERPGRAVLAQQEPREAAPSQAKRQQLGWQPQLQVWASGRRCRSSLAGCSRAVARLLPLAGGWLPSRQQGKALRQESLVQWATGAQVISRRVWMGAGLSCRWSAFSALLQCSPWRFGCLVTGQSRSLKAGSLHVPTSLISGRTQPCPAPSTAANPCSAAQASHHVQPNAAGFPVRL